MRIEPAAALGGHFAVPGDKSISHRAVLLGAVSEGETRVLGFGRSADTEATIAAVRAMGVEVYDNGEDQLTVFGVGLRGLRAPREPIDARNAGTLMRLLPGLLAGQSGRFVLTGDESLRTRPMDRIAEPLGRMGVAIETTAGTAPVTVEGGSVHAMSYKLPVASAQIKSAVLLAGLFVRGGETTTVVDDPPTRDHTELMLQHAGVPVERRPTSVSVRGVERLQLDEIDVPGDFSSAAPFILAATIVPGSELYLHGIGLNPRRTGLLDVLERMGAKITVFNRRKVGAEPVGDLEIRSAPLVSASVRVEEVPRMIDELPLVALAAMHAHGESIVTGAKELRVKESDRIEGVVNAVRALGGRASELEDGFKVKGVPTRLRGGRVRSLGDHRLAMLGAVAGVASREGVDVEDAESVAVSFPAFYELLEAAAHR